MATRIGVDIGGTFTDLVYYDDETGETVEGKVPTVPHAPEEGVVAAVSGHVPRAVIEKGRVLPAWHDGRPQRAPGAARRQGRG